MTPLEQPISTLESAHTGERSYHASLFVVAMVTACLILVSIFSYYIYVKSFAVASRRIETIGIALHEATAGHLAFEEILAGDEQATLEAVWPYFDNAEKTLRTLLDGGVIDTGTVPALTDTSDRILAEDVLEATQTFREHITERYGLLVKKQPALVLDRKMDDTYLRLIDQAQTLAHDLRHDADRGTTRTKYVHIVLVAFYLLLSASLVLVFARLERNRARATQLLLHRESQLRQARKMEVVGNLAGGIAHDFNNLLQTILGYGELLAADLARDKRSTEEIDYILHAGRRAADLTRQLLAYSRRQMITPTDLDLNDLITDLFRMLQRLIGENINLETALADKPVVIHADRTQVEQILMNLCLNSRDAITGAGTVTVAVERVQIDESYRATHAWATPGSYAQLTVTDDGTGIPDEVIDQVFEPFFTTKEVGKGTGLGLSTVYGIVKQNNGMISIYSEVGRGTTIRIHWPLGAQTPQAQPNTPDQPVPRGHQTILVAEDDQNVREFVSRVLTEAGYEVIMTQDGKEAIEAFNTQSESIDLVLLDVVMPHFGGKEVMDLIRRLGSSVPILFCSGYSTNSVHTDFVLDEGIVLLEKPYLQHELLERIHHALHPDGTS